jgi:hypothetical protein
MNCFIPFIIDADLLQGVSQVIDNTWKVEKKGVKSLVRNQRGFMTKYQDAPSVYLKTPMLILAEYIGEILCVNLCEKNFQNLLKRAKIEKIGKTTSL